MKVEAAKEKGALSIIPRALDTSKEESAIFQQKPKITDTPDAAKLVEAIEVAKE